MHDATYFIGLCGNTFQQEFTQAACANRDTTEMYGESFLFDFTKLLSGNKSEKGGIAGGNSWVDMI